MPPTTGGKKAGGSTALLLTARVRAAPSMRVFEGRRWDLSANTIAKTYVRGLHVNPTRQNLHVANWGPPPSSVGTPANIQRILAHLPLGKMKNCCFYLLMLGLKNAKLSMIKKPLIRGERPSPKESLLMSEATASNSTAPPTEELPAQ